MSSIARPLLHSGLPLLVLAALMRARADAHQQGHA